MRIRILIVLMGLSWSSAAQDGSTGLLVMAHGGTDEWNGFVHEAVAELRSDLPVAVAFGMANPMTMKAAVDSLLARSVSRIRVVRLFLSGESFLESTGYILGLHDRRPEGGMHADHMRQLDIPVPVTLSREGLLDAPEVGVILRKRAMKLSRNPMAESVLFIAHGAASDQENETWLRRMEGLADSVRTAASFFDVRAETLREDWDEPRAEAERRIRDFVRAETTAGRDVLIIPFRLAGFGPYAEVLDGLDYRSDGIGLLPDQRITDWIRRLALTETVGATEDGNVTNLSPR